MSVPRLPRLADRLEQMRACDEGMGMHCIDLLIDEVQPLVAALLVAALLADYGQCPTHGYVEVSHRCAFYGGEPLVYVAATSVAGGE